MENKQSKWKTVLWIISLIVVGILGATGNPVNQKDEKKTLV